LLFLIKRAILNKKFKSKGDKHVIYFIINPAAGSGRAKAAVPVIEKIMHEYNADYTLIYTLGTEDFTRVAGLIDWSIAKTVACVGGDGTIQEYIGLAVGRDINFAVIPAGSGNDLMLSVPAGAAYRFPSFKEKVEFYSKKIINGESALIDAVSVNGDKYFLNIGGTGIDIQVLQDALPLKKLIGKAAYFTSLIKNVVTYNAGKIALTVDDKPETDKFLVLAVCNGAYYGGGMNIAPPAVINDGFITLCKVRNMPRIKMMKMFPSVRSGAHSKLEEVSFINCSSVKLEFDGIKTINLDGNLLDFKSPLIFKIIKDAVKFII
jgi:YegS/Rv2252/BmrU family lipid kinase